MKAILMSIQPKWVEKILNGEKTIDIRKTAPKCKLPVEVYIYCTKGKHTLTNTGDGWKLNDNRGLTSYYGNGKVVAKFTIGKVHDFYFTHDKYGSHLYGQFRNKELLLKLSQLTENQLIKYIGDKFGYAWHIFDLQVFDKPMELGEFKRLPCAKSEKACEDCKDKYVEHTQDSYEIYCRDDNRVLTRPPQSYMYVEV
jgi:Uncharacterized conserved protein